MELGKILEFRKDLYFEGAVQADWFYSPEKASKVAENFVFHGSSYYGVEDQGVGVKKRIDTISLVKQLVEKLIDDKSNALSLAIADYGTGKSHLAIAMAQIFSGAQYMPETYKKVIGNIARIDAESAKQIEELSTGRNFVMVINGMRDFNLHSEILRAAQRSMQLYGLPDDSLRKLNRAVETAEMFFSRNAASSIGLFEAAAAKKGWVAKGDNLVSQIKEKLMVDDEAFDIVNEVYLEINGQEIRWDEGLSASSILEMLVSEYCGMNGLFDHIILLFDEFGRYLEYASGVNAAKSGESGLQQIYELTQKTQNVEGYLHVINFIQSDIKTYLQRVDQTKNISRYIGRFDESEKYYISSNLETVFANLIQRKDKQAFVDYIVKWQNGKEDEWKSLFNNLNRWIPTKGMWKDYKLFRKVAVEGIYPMHPISTYMLTNLSDYLQNRSSLTLISRYIDDYSEADIENQSPLVMPEHLITGDLYTEMLSAEQEGRQKTQQCIKYDSVIGKYSDKLSEKSLSVLRANLILRILRFKTADYDDAKLALSICSGLTISEVEEELNWLEKEYAVIEFDDHAYVFDFTEESNGAHDFKVIKKRLMVNASIDKTEINNLKVQEIAGVTEVQITNFGTNHKITTNEWVFEQELYPIEEFTLNRANKYIDGWKQATSSVTPKGKLIWLYVNKETSKSCLDDAMAIAKGFSGKPIVVMLLNDAENRLFDTLVEYRVLDSMEMSVRNKYERHFDEDFARVERNLKDEFEYLKKQRQRVMAQEIVTVERMSLFLTKIFDEIYPEAVPFFFDSFITKNNNIAGKAGGIYCSLLKIFLSNSVSENTIHNFGVETRNRAEALFFVSAATSWKCISENYKVMPPQEKKANSVYEDIATQINNKKEIKCNEIYERFSQPPYGMSEDVITMMIAVICANLNYCLRVRHGELKNINIWKDEVVINNDKKVDIKAIKESILVFVDAGAVASKYMRFFEQVKSNKDVFVVIDLERQLKIITSVDEVPEELEQAYLLAQKNLETGRKARKLWNEAISAVGEKYNDVQDEGQIYNALVALELLRDMPIEAIFNDNGYLIDDNSKEYLNQLRKKITSFIDNMIDTHIASMNCTAIEKLMTFRNHQNKIIEKLKGLGFTDYASRVNTRKEEELNNVEEMRSRQELREDYSKYMDDSRTDRFTPYTAICSLLKDGKALQVRVEKYRKTLGKDADIIDSTLNKRVNDLENVKERIIKDMTDIWDDLLEVKNAEDVEDLLDRIALVLQKGLAQNDQKGLEELLSNLQELLDDINKIKEATKSRKEFAEISIGMKNKYAESNFDFEVVPILEDVIAEIAKTLDEKESEWKTKNLSLGDKSRAAVHRWKSCIEFLPEFLSEQTLVEIHNLDQEAEIIISEGKIEDVMYYFEKLDDIEKKECLSKIMELLK